MDASGNPHPASGMPDPASGSPQPASGVAQGGSTAPWDAPDAFPAKPEGHEYGYKSFSRLVPCTKEELADWFKFGNVIRPKLVWTPESPRLVTPAETALLWAPVRDICVRRYVAIVVLLLILTGLLGVLVASPRIEFRFHRPYHIASLFLTGLVPLLWACGRLRSLLKAAPGDTTHVGRQARFFAWTRSRRLNTTWVIAGCLAVAGLSQLVFGESRSFGAAAFDRPTIVVGEYWRLLTSSFLHVSWEHFASNVLFIAVLTWLMENLASRHHAAIVFLASCIAGSLGCLLVPFHNGGAGASDGLYGLFGFLLIQSVIRRSSFPAGMWKILLWSFVVSCAAEWWTWNRGVNSVAHISGFVVGLILGAFLPRLGSRAIRVGGVSSRALIVVSALGVVALTAAGRPGINSLLTVAWNANEAGDHEKALACYTQALRINPKHVDAFMGRASILHATKDLEGARADYEAVLAFDPDNEVAWLWKGSTRAEMGDLKGGLEDLDRCLAINPKTEFAHVQRAWVRYLRGEHDEAMKDVALALYSEPDDPFAVVIRGRIKASRGDLDSAIDDYTRAILTMRDPDAHVARGDAKRAKGDQEGALADYYSAMSISRDDPDALFGRGLVRVAQKDTAAARADFEAALKSAHRWWRRRAEVEAALKELDK